MMTKSDPAEGERTKMHREVAPDLETTCEARCFDVVGKYIEVDRESAESPFFVRRMGEGLAESEGDGRLLGVPLERRGEGSPGADVVAAAASDMRGEHVGDGLITGRTEGRRDDGFGVLAGVRARVRSGRAFSGEGPGPGGDRDRTREIETIDAAVGGRRGGDDGVRAPPGLIEQAEASTEGIALGAGEDAGPRDQLVGALVEQCSEASPWVGRTFLPGLGAKPGVPRRLSPSVSSREAWVGDGPMGSRAHRTRGVRADGKTRRRHHLRGG